MSKQTEWFVSYEFKNEDSQGFGQCHMTQAGKVFSVLEAQKALNKEYGLKSVVVLNFIRHTEPPYPESESIDARPAAS